jgi:death-on-curing protein
LIQVNRDIINQFGGLWTPPNNVFNAPALAYLVEAVKAEMFGAPLYKSVHEKAAVYCHNIIKDHIFCDGNKRTGMQSALAFLEINGFPPSPSLTSQAIVDFALRVATGGLSTADIALWFETNTQSPPILN